MWKHRVQERGPDKRKEANERLMFQGQTKSNIHTELAGFWDTFV